MTTETTRQSHFTVSARTVAMGSTIVALTCLTTLAVVTSLEGGKGLETVALALAILAFVVQLIVFIVQGATASQQLLRNEELYGRMQDVLGRIHEKAAGTQAAVSRIEDRIFDSVAKAVPQATGAGVDPSSPEFVEQVAYYVARTLESDAATAGGTDERAETLPFPPRVPNPDDERVVQMLRTFPPVDEARTALEIARELDALELLALLLLGRDELLSRSGASSFGPGLRSASRPGLHDHGLIERVDWPEELYQLTEKGRRVARLLTASGPPPPDLADEVRALQEKAARLSSLAREIDERDPESSAD